MTINRMLTIPQRKYLVIWYRVYKMVSKKVGGYWSFWIKFVFILIESLMRGVTKTNIFDSYVWYMSKRINSNWVFDVDRLIASILIKEQD